MSFETILFDTADGVATITLNRPDVLNAFNDAMIGETIAALKQCTRDDAIRSIVLTGAGRGFSSGQDLASFRERGPDETIGDHLRHRYHRLIKQLVTLEKPVIGAINGIAAGAGCGIALATDIRIVSDKASFMLAFSRVGLIPDSGLNWFLPRLVGYGRAYEMAVTADRISAESAYEWGMVNRVVPADQLNEIARALALQLAEGATMAFGLTKRAMFRSSGSSLDEALVYEAYLQDIAAQSEDSREGISAFLEKRQAEFKGH